MLFMLSKEYLVLTLLSTSSEKLKRNASTATRQNLDKLRNAVLTKDSALEKLRVVKDQHDVGYESLVEGAAELSFEAELHELPAQPSDSSSQPFTESKSQKPSYLNPRESHAYVSSQGDGSLVMTNEVVTWEKVLLRSYKKLSAAPPVLETLLSALPPPANARQGGARPSNPDAISPSEHVGEQSNHDTDAEIKTLLGEWTTTSEPNIEQQFASERMNDRARIPGAPQWVQDGYFLQRFLDASH
jgi:hypothetical protein